MYGYPEEYELLSMFECEPKLYDANTENLPFFYNQATYEFSNHKEHFVVTISPSYEEVKIQVTDTLSNELLSYLHLKRVHKFEIVADKKDHSSVLLTIQHDDTLQTFEIDFKPRFKLILKEHKIIHEFD